MSKYSSKNAAFQFGLLLFMVAGLSIGIILTTGKASLIFSPSAQVVEYIVKPVPVEDINIVNMQGHKPRITCTPDGGRCGGGKIVCCGVCDKGICTSLKCEYEINAACTKIGNKPCCAGLFCKTQNNQNYGNCRPR